MRRKRMSGSEPGEEPGHRAYAVAAPNLLRIAIAKT